MKYRTLAFIADVLKEKEEKSSSNLKYFREELRKFREENCPDKDDNCPEYLAEKLKVLKEDVDFWYKLENEAREAREDFEATDWH